MFSVSKIVLRKVRERSKAAAAAAAGDDCDDAVVGNSSNSSGIDLHCFSSRQQSIGMSFQRAESETYRDLKNSTTKCASMSCGMRAFAGMCIKRKNDAEMETASA